MLFTNVFTYTVALAAAVPMVVGQDWIPFHPKYVWDKELRVYKLGAIPSRSTKNPDRAADWLGRCAEGDVGRGKDVDLSSYGCGLFKDLGTVIYKCVKEKKTGEPWLKRHEVCLWTGAGAGGQCVRNQLRDGAKFYPFVSSSKVVCVQPTEVYSEKSQETLIKTITRIDARAIAARPASMKRAQTTYWDRSDAGDQSRNRSSSAAEYVYGLVQMVARDLIPSARDRECIVNAFSVQAPVALVACSNTPADSLHV